MLIVGKQSLQSDSNGRLDREPRSAAVAGDSCHLPQRAQMIYSANRASLQLRICRYPLVHTKPIKPLKMKQLPNPDDYRRADYPVETIFVRRWSPRAMSGEPITDEEMMTLFEAARWAPSTYNEQEWRFLYARRDTPQWQMFFDLLVEFNQSWCHRAALLAVVLGHKVFQQNGKENPVHLLDCGSAFENLALQGTALQLVVHGMQGFDFEKARRVLRVPDDYAVAMMFAVGRPGDPDDLPKSAQEREKPSGRKPARELIGEGTFAFS
jgi:nitroreductase